MIDQSKIERLTLELLTELGEDVQRSGLLETPERVARAWVELTKGLHEEPPDLKLFEADNNEMVIVRDIAFSSMCEHHLLPYMGVAHVGYIPVKQVVGLSKIPRTIVHFAAKPTIQESLVKEVADYLFQKLNPAGLIVVMEAEHLCMQIRGAKQPNSRMVSSAIRGDIDKAEFLALLRNGRG